MNKDTEGRQKAPNLTPILSTGSKHVEDCGTADDRGCSEALEAQSLFFGVNSVKTL